MKIKYLILLASAITITFSQTLELSNYYLHFTSGNSPDTILLYNTGTSPLVIDTIFSESNSIGYYLDVFEGDSTIGYHIAIFQNAGYFAKSISAADSIRLLFYYPHYAICKRTEDWNDTLIIHSNSLSGNYTKITVNGNSSLSVNSVDPTLANYELLQNYPNPFNPTTFISFSIAEDDFVNLSIFNELGQQVAVVYSGRLKRGGYIKTWDATNFTSGIYYSRIETSHFTETRKMILLK